MLEIMADRPALLALRSTLLQAALNKASPISELPAHLPRGLRICNPYCLCPGVLLLIKKAQLI